MSVIHSPLLLLPLLFWGLICGLLVVAVTFAVLAVLRTSRAAVWVAGGALVLALLLTLSVTTSLGAAGPWLAGPWSSGGAEAGWPPAAGPLGALIALLGCALAVFGGGPIAQLALGLATRGSVPAGSHGGILVEEPRRDGGSAASATAPPAAATAGPEAPGTAAPVTQASTREVLRGGAAIGILERLCVVIGIIAGFPEVLAIVVAVKGLGRFTELATAEARERFIIGTLASLLWAGACAVLVRLALG